MSIVFFIYIYGGGNVDTGNKVYICCFTKADAFRVCTNAVLNNT